MDHIFQKIYWKYKRLQQLVASNFSCRLFTSCCSFRYASSVNSSSTLRSLTVYDTVLFSTSAIRIRWNFSFGAILFRFFSRCVVSRNIGLPSCAVSLTEFFAKGIVCIRRIQVSYHNQICKWSRTCISIHSSPWKANWLIFLKLLTEKPKPEMWIPTYIYKLPTICEFSWSSAMLSSGASLSDAFWKGCNCNAIRPELTSIL